VCRLKTKNTQTEKNTTKSIYTLDNQIYRHIKPLDGSYHHLALDYYLEKIPEAPEARLYKARKKRD